MEKCETIRVQTAVAGWQSVDALFAIVNAAAAVVDDVVVVYC